MRLGEISYSYEIHAGYQRVLLGFLREIDLVRKDKIAGEKLDFRAHYLIKVLDALVKELQELKTRPRAFESQGQEMKTVTGEPHLFRSQVLNPILQRQLRGIQDDNPDQVKGKVGRTVRGAQAFYLPLDPLHPDLAWKTLRNLIYISPIRFSLAFFSRRAENADLNSALLNTEQLEDKRKEYPADAWDESILYDFEIELIKKEHLQELYRGMMEISVSRGCFLGKYFSLTSP